MDAFRFVAKLPYKFIVEWLRDETTALSNTMTICTRTRSRCSEDEITMGIQRLVAYVAAFDTLRVESHVEREYSC